jgi:hypothetical protein
MQLAVGASYRKEYTHSIVDTSLQINPATGVTLRDPLMPGLLLDSFSAPAFSGGCAVDASNVVTCTGGSIGPESTTTATLTLVAPSAVGTITNIVTIDPNNAIFEADETNNTATATTQVVTGIDLTVSKADAIDPIATSGTETYTIKVNNLGTQDASAIRVRVSPTGSHAGRSNGGVPSWWKARSVRPRSVTSGFGASGGR